MNAYTTEEIGKRKLQFSADKCVRIHVKAKNGVEEKECEQISIEGWKEETYEEDSKLKQRDIHTGETEIKTVDHHLYLGDIVESNCSNKKNVLARAAKGQGVVRDIIQILEGTFFGSFYFEAMKLMREAMLMSVITNNLEVSFNLTPKDIKVLNDLDTQLIRSCLLLGAKASQCLMFLELGLVPVSFLIKKKRILYLFHLLTTDKSSLVSLVFQQQVKSAQKTNWVNTVIKDLKDFYINMSFTQIAQSNKMKFKALVKQSCEKAAFLSLLKQKESLSKGKNLEYNCFEIQPYFKPESNLSLETMRRIYSVKCREIPVKANFTSAYKDATCPFTDCTALDTQKHLFDSSCFSNDNQLIQYNTQYEDIFGTDIQAQVKVIKIFFSRLQIRNKFLTLTGQGIPADPSTRTTVPPRLGIQKAKSKNNKTKIKKKSSTRLKALQST